MNEQITMSGVDIAPSKDAEFLKRKRKWEKGFQKWSDSQVDEYSSLGKCGYGSMCDYCEDVSYGRPCVRALNEMLRETDKTIDYENMSFEDVWEGARS